MNLGLTKREVRGKYDYVPVKKKAAPYGAALT